MTIEKLLFELNASSILTKDAVTKRPLNSLELFIIIQGQSGVNSGSKIFSIALSDFIDPKPYLFSPKKVKKRIFDRNLQIFHNQISNFIHEFGPLQWVTCRPCLESRCRRLDRFIYIL